MKKIRLDMEALVVESFHTVGGVAARESDITGALLGCGSDECVEDSANPDACAGAPTAGTCNATCPNTCRNTCPNTCGAYCGWTHNATCTCGGWTNCANTCGGGQTCDTCTGDPTHPCHCTL